MPVVSAVQDPGAAHPARSLTVTASVNYQTDGRAAVTVQRTGRLQLRDPLAASVEDGDIEQHRDDFDALFGFAVVGSWSTSSRSLITSTVSAGYATGSDTDVWTLGPGIQGFEFLWSPTLTGADTATVRVSVRGGLLVGVSGTPVPPHTSDSVTLTSGAMDAYARIALARTGAQPGSVPDLAPGSPDPPGSFGLPPLGLGAVALSIVVALSAAVLAFPALMLLREPRSPVSLSRNVPGVGVAASGALASVVVATTELRGDDWLTAGDMWILILAVPVLMSLFGGLPRFGLRSVFGAWADAVLGLSFAAGAAALLFVPASSAHSARSLLVALGSWVVAALVAWRGPGRLVRMSAVLVPVVLLRYLADASSLGTVSFDQGAIAQWLSGDAWPGAVFAATAAAVALVSVGVPSRSSRAWSGLLALIGLAGLPLMGLDSVGNPYWTTVAQAAVVCIVFVAAAIAVVVLVRAGSAADGVADEVARVASVALLAVSISGFGWIAPWWAGLCTVIALVAGRVLLPRSRARRAILLARVRQSEHLGHVLALQQARTKAAVDRRYHLDSAAAIAGQKLTMSEYLSESKRLRSESAKATDPHRTELALGTFTGDTPWRSGVAGLMLGTLVGLPLMILTVARAAESTWSVVQAGSVLALGVVVLHAARWSIYGLVYGYFYPWLRGRTAFAKAAWLATVMLVPELAVPWSAHSTDAVITDLGIDTVQLFAFTAVLALTWEIRQARRASVSWDGVRDLRSLRALAAPASAILLAIVTAAATTLANAEIPSWVGPQQSQSTPGSPANPSVAK